MAPERRHFKARIILYLNPYFTKYTLFCLFCWFLFRNVTELYRLCNDTHFLSGMLLNFMNYATKLFLTSKMLWNFTDCATMLLFDFRNVAEHCGLCNNASFLLPKCRGTLQIAQQCFFLTSRMSRKFAEYLTMDVKYLEAIKRRLHATKQWSPEEIRV